MNQSKELRQQIYGPYLPGSKHSLNQRVMTAHRDGEQRMAPSRKEEMSQRRHQRKEEVAKLLDDAKLARVLGRTALAFSGQWDGFCCNTLQAEIKFLQASGIPLSHIRQMSREDKYIGSVIANISKL